MILNTRPPTGLPAWPMILLDGRSKSGVTQTALRLSASDRIGETFVFEVGSSDADTYAALGDFAIVNLDGTWADFHTQLLAATSTERLDPDLPNAIIIDVANQIWADLGTWTEQRARNNRDMRARLRKDPDALVDTSGYWGDTKTRWFTFMRILQKWDGIVVLCARGDDVAVYENGVPVPGATAYRVGVEKTTASLVNYNVTMVDGVATVVSANHLDVQPGTVLPTENALEHLLFDLAGFTVDSVETRVPVGAMSGTDNPVAATKQWLAAVFVAGGYEEAEAKAAAAAVWADEFPGNPNLFEVTAESITRLREAAEVVMSTPPEPNPDERPFTDEADAELAADDAETPESGPDGTGA